jgi:hypothetical protein
MLFLNEQKWYHAIHMSKQTGMQTFRSDVWNDDERNIALLNEIASAFIVEIDIYIP